MAFLKDLGCRICQLSGESKATPYLFRHLSSLHVAVQQGNSAMGTLNFYYVLNPPCPVKFCSLSLSLISSSSSNINFIHIHTWSLYIRSLAFECCNIALVLLTSYQSFACNACQCCMSMKLFILLISCSLASSLSWCA